MSTNSDRWASVKQSFVAGLLSILPLYITAKILLFVFQLIDGPLGTAINGAIHQATGWQGHIPGLGLIGTGLLVVGVGWLTRNVFFQRMQITLDEFIGQIPVVRSLYNASRQIVVPFTDQSKLPFSQVILAQYPMPGRWTLGLVAREHVCDDPEDPRMVIFFPTNHLHLGYPVVMSRHEVQRIDMSMEEAVKFFVSCGVVGDENLLRYKGEQIHWSEMMLPVVGTQKPGAQKPVTTESSGVLLEKSGVQA